MGEKDTVHDAGPQGFDLGNRIIKKGQWEARFVVSRRYGLKKKKKRFP